MEIKFNYAEKPFTLDYTLSCGQTFRWEKHGSWWTGVANQTVFRMQQRNGTLEFKASSNHADSDFLFNYFRLNDDLPKIYSKIQKDKYMREAVRKFYGLRIVRQEPWECLISYLCATNNNIPAIKQMIYNLCRQFGKSAKFENETYFAFPTAQALAKANLRELRLCKLGYRAPCVLETAKLIKKGSFDLEALKTMPYEMAKKQLVALPGVGAKVADCVLLFSLDKLEAFPIDVWMRRIILEYYPQHFAPEFVTKMKTKKGISPQEYQTIYSFGREYFGEFLGYAQEYLYHHKRCQQKQNT